MKVSSNFDSRDVERICKENYDRRKLREERREERREEEWEPAEAKNDCGLLRNVVLTCAAVAGGGAAVVGMGAAMGNGMAVFMGICTVTVFALFGCAMESFREKEERK